MQTRPIVGALVLTSLLLSCSKNDVAPTRAVLGTRKALDRETAARILESQGFRDVAIGAIIAGATQFDEGIIASDNATLVLAVAHFEKKTHNVEASFYFDDELGWFCFEQDRTRDTLRLWSTAGYREVHPAPRLAATPTPAR